MKIEYDKEIRLNRYGEPDTDYYLALAKQMRAQMAAEMFHAVVELVKRPFRNLVHKQLKAA